ncbi:MAG TPA: sensor domain-containing diguanylate cyclase [Methylomirabilota bacterium]|jgi:diguanylate cyclase (GGDEF)-like protein
MTDRGSLLEELLEIGLALTTERDLGTLLERILGAARRFTGAEAGTVFVREGDHLRFAVVQNDLLQRKVGVAAMRERLQSEPLRLTEPSLAGHVAQTGEIVNVADAYAIGMHETRALNRRFDAASEYSTRSVLAVPLQDASGSNVGVLELLNALDDAGVIVPFDPDDERVIRALASQAAVAIRNARLEDLSFKDVSTELYNSRYFALRIDEEVKRHTRFGHPLSLVALNVDHFKQLNEEHGSATGDEVLREIARLLVKHSRSFTIIARLEGDGFAALLANTPKAGAVTYAQRIRGVIAAHAFAPGPITGSFGVAGLPADAASAEDLIAAAQRALSEAKRLGRNRVTAL